jgi:hypothetical protein
MGPTSPMRPSGNQHAPEILSYVRFGPSIFQYRSKGEGHDQKAIPPFTL